jgi:hypothetical protein
VVGGFPYISVVDDFGLQPVCAPNAEILRKAFDRSMLLFRHGVGRTDGGMCVLSVYMDVRMALTGILRRVGAAGLRLEWTFYVVCVSTFYFVRQSAIEDGMLQ